jgi:hypothetical protein
VPTLFTKDEFSALSKAPKKIILEAIESHGMVRKTDKKKISSKVIYGKTTPITEVQRKQISLRLWQREGIVQLEYYFPFVPSKYVNVSSGVYVESDFPESVRINIPTNLERITVLSKVKDSQKLRHEISKVRFEHRNRIKKQYLDLRKKGKPLAEIRRLGRYFQRYYPFEFFAVENIWRYQNGFEQIPDKYILKPIKFQNKRDANKTQTLFRNKTGN